MKVKDFLLKSLWQDPNYEIHQLNCPEITLEEVDKEFYGHLLAEATAAGAKFDGAKASISSCDFDWNYDAAARTLNITCTRKPFFITCGEVESKIRDLVGKAKGAI